jgi:hypothetical protein
MTNVVLIDKSDLETAVKTAVKSAIIELNEEQKKQAEGEKLYTINQVRKRLGKAHATIKKLIRLGYLKTTKDGLIPEASINEYLQRT